MNNYAALGLSGRVVRVNGQVKAYTIGFKLSGDSFCILFEVSDLSIKGAAQFIFREFSRELKSYRYINAMDDSGLANLERAKLSYRPCNTIPRYRIRRKC